MHAGYPIMGPVRLVPKQVNVTNIRANGIWDIIHETGHNHQWLSWTIPALTDTSNNWWSLYINQKVIKS
jgi:hypothetical protein